MPVIISRNTKLLCYKICYKVLLGLVITTAMLIATLLTARYKSYGPLEIISSVKNVNRSRLSTTTEKNNNQHLQLIGNLKSFSVPSTVPLSRPSISNCTSDQVTQKYLFATVNQNEEGNFSCRSVLKGFLIPSSRRISIVTSRVSTDLVYSLEKDFQEDIQDHFSHWGGDILPIGPSFAISKDELVLVSRIWLNKEKKFITDTDPIVEEVERALFDNYLFKISYDLSFKKITHGSLLNINIPNLRRALSGDGPLDPKVFFYNGRLHVLFNSAISDEKGGMYDRMFLHTPDLGPDSVYELRIDGFKRPQRDKGWSPLISSDNSLYFVVRYEPLVVVKCDPNDFAKSCTVVVPKNESHLKMSNFADGSIHLRGGTPFVEYMHPYYVSVGHGTYFFESGTRYYTTNIILLNLLSKSIVYVSSDVSFSEQLLHLTKPTRPWVTAYPFFFALGLKASADELIVSGHFNDNLAALVRISGVKDTFDAVIAADMESVGTSSNNEPSYPWSINSLLLRQLGNETGLNFVRAK